MLLKGCVSSSQQHHHPMAGKNSEGVPASGCHSVSPPQNPRLGFVGSASRREFGQLLLIKPAFGSSACLPATAMPLLPLTAWGIAGVSGMPPQSRSWPASAPSWKSMAVFNYGPAARFVNRVPSAFPLLHFKDLPRCNCKSAARLRARRGISRWERLCAAAAPGKVPGAGSSISWTSGSDLPRRSGAAGGPPAGAGKGRTGKEGAQRMETCRKSLSAASCPRGCGGCFVSTVCEELRRSRGARGRGRARQLIHASRWDGAELQHIPAHPRAFFCIRV